MTELEKKLTELLAKHGICVDCGEMFSHDIDQPFAACKCKNAEWYEMTPYMELELKLKTLAAENIALVTALRKQTLTGVDLPEDTKVELKEGVHSAVDAMAYAVDQHIKLIAAKTWSNLEDVKGRAIVEAFENLLARTCPVSGHVIADENSRKAIQEYADECKPKCGHPDCK